MYKKVSAVVTTRNEEPNIANCLISLVQQDYSNFEIIVVDNSSNDKTQEIARTYTELVYEKGPERSAQRNYGMLEVATGEYVIYVDADMLLTPDVISLCVTHLESSNAVGLYIPEFILGRSYFAKVRRFERAFYNATPIDAARFFRRSAICAVGGFDEDLFKKGSGEDWDLDKQVKLLGQIEMVNTTFSNSGRDNYVYTFAEKRGFSEEKNFSGIFHNEEHDRLAPYLSKKSYYSEGFSGYISKWGNHDEDIRKQFGINYRLFGVFIENKKWRKFLSHPILALSVFLLKLMVGVASYRGIKRKTP